MKFNIYFTIRGPGGEIDAPNNTNPVECANLASLMLKLSSNLPKTLGMETVGIRIEEAK